MTSGAITTENFARHVTSQLDDSFSATGASHELTMTSSTPASVTELMELAAALDIEIQQAKTQVYRKLLSNYSAFSDSMEHSFQLKDSIDKLLEQAEEISSNTMDPENGLRHKAMSVLVEYYETSYKVQENEAVLNGLDHFLKINDILSQYDTHMKSGEIYQAGCCIRQADYCSIKATTFDQVLEDLIRNAVSTWHSEEVEDIYQFQITILYDVESPLSAPSKSGTGSAPNTIRWQALLSALTLLDVASEKLQPLQKELVRHLLEPLISRHAHSTAKIEPILDKSGTFATKASLSLSISPEQEKSNDDLFNNVLEVFRFIREGIFLIDDLEADPWMEDDTSASTILVQLIGHTIAKEACSLLSRHHLPNLIPSDAQDMRNFTPIVESVEKFENELRALGFLTEADQELSEFVHTIDVHYTNRKRDTLLKKGRAMIMNDDFKVIAVKDIDQHDELEQSGGAWGYTTDSYTDLKDSSISAESKQLIEMILATLEEARSLNETASPYLYQATRSLIDLYRGLMPIYHNRTLTSVPALAILFYNDCMYIARELDKVPMRFEDGIPGMEEVQYEDVVPSIKALGKTWLDFHVGKQRDELMQSIDDAGKFKDTNEERNFDSCERSMKQIVFVLKHLGRVWKPTLSQTGFYNIMGQLLDGAVKRIIRELEDLTDISEKESHTLAMLCNVLVECEGQFDDAAPLVAKLGGEPVKREAIPRLYQQTLNTNKKPIQYFVPSWEKFRVLTEILELSFADIMIRFRLRQLAMFDERELCQLICALFADTSLRQKNLDEIQQGHPMLHPWGTS
ncbi:Centromere/kinetochore protein zw10 [Lunasporangiospora selenospora]|uniref:Centromere/kinetochore protein zw10 n=1 Tax=Lunasporangiospora selenospora TaxID=979761 RepID=A0A9P6G2A9_9FUNG|nr:Centromere/kinetochore protein zw10 [Lunasporangiospora selenospora]